MADVHKVGFCNIDNCDSLDFNHFGGNLRQFSSATFQSIVKRYILVCINTNTIYNKFPLRTSTVYLAFVSLYQRHDTFLRYVIHVSTVLKVRNHDS